MATSASQPYIAKLGFQDKDRGTDRHGLACEYLFERLLEMEINPAWRECPNTGAKYKAGLCINQPIKSGSRYVVGFADVLMWSDAGQVLGEVKITKEPAETVLQQVNFYQAHLHHVNTVYILTDYDCSDLQRIVEGTHIKVYRLGRRFEQWLASRVQLTTEEL